MTPKHPLSEHSYSEFHAVQGWYFQRASDGGVRIRHGNGPDMEDVVLDANTWASVVASVSAQGERSETFHQALGFHQAESPERLRMLMLTGQVLDAILAEHEKQAKDALGRLRAALRTALQGEEDRRS